MKIIESNTHINYSIVIIKIVCVSVCLTVYSFFTHKFETFSKTQIFLMILIV